MGRKVWCSHCNRLVTRQREQEHRKLLFSPYVPRAPTSSYPPAWAPTVTHAGPSNDSTNHHAGDFVEVDFDTVMADQGGTEPSQEAVQERLPRCWKDNDEDGEVEADGMDGSDWREKELPPGEDLGDEDTFDWEAFERAHRVSSCNLSAQDELSMAYERDVSQGMP